jgi:phosphoribosylformylglycinamidine synthase
VYLTNAQQQDGEAIKIPIAHGEGRYYASEAVIASLKNNNQILYTYCDEFGGISDTSNPNGATDNIAGICNEGRNVFGMMPHPERVCSEKLGNIDGKKVFKSLFGIG